MIQFLKSHTTSSYDRIKIRPLPSPVINFCSNAESFKNELDGLPILVTNDGVLRCFDVHQTVYCSRFCDLFQKSASRFVHKRLVAATRSLNAEGVKTDISMDELEEVLGAEVDVEVFTVSDSVVVEDMPNAFFSWISRLWQFIIDRYRAAKAKQHGTGFKN